MINRIISALDKTQKLFSKLPVDDYYKLMSVAKNTKPNKLHFGCGPRVLKDWINIDLQFEPYEEYLKYYGDEFFSKKIRGTKNDFYAIDITVKGLPLPDSSVNVIFHEDFIEHIDQRQQVIFLAETLRVLKKGGVHRINTPNLLSTMRDNSTFSMGLKGVYQDEWFKHVHKNILTPNTLKDLAQMVGYSRVIIQSRNKSISKLIPAEYRPDINDRPEDGNIFADLIK